MSMEQPRDESGKELEAFKEMVREGVGEFIEFVGAFGGDKPYGVDIASWDSLPDQRSLDELSPIERAFLEEELMSALGVDPSREDSLVRRYKKQDTSDTSSHGREQEVEVYRSDQGDDVSVHIQHTDQGRILWVGPADIDISDI